MREHFSTLKSASLTLVRSRTIRWTLVAVGALTVFLSTGWVAHEIVFANRLYPNLYFMDENLSWKTFDEARRIVDARLDAYAAAGVQARHGDQNFNGTFTDYGIDVDREAALQALLDYGRDGAYPDNLTRQLTLLRTAHRVDPVFRLDTTGDAYRGRLQQIRQALESPEIDAALTLADGKAQVAPERPGSRVDTDAFTGALTAALAALEPPGVDIGLTPVEPRIRTADLEPLKPVLEAWGKRRVTFAYELARWEIEPPVLSGWLTTGLDESGAVALTANTDTARNYLWEKAETGINRNPSNAVFELEDGRVKRFEPGKSGIVADLDATLANLDAAMRAGQAEVPVAVIATEPEITTDEVNDLGIRERVAMGVSYYTGSSRERIANIKTGTEKLNGTIIKPGEVFSFNNTVGEITADAGFVEGLIISGGATVPGVGGGICQTSTTLFRAILEGGYPVVERHSHSYRVKYYEIAGPGFEVGKPGIDAAIYSPTLDLKFKNDTPYAILIQTHMIEDKHQLVYEFFSTKTDRTVAIGEPKVYNLRSPLPDVYYDDPEQPAGYLKQVDWAVGGADTEFTRTVTYPDGRSETETFKTSYRPWSSKYIRGTKPADPAPETAPVEETGDASAPATT